MKSTYKKIVLVCLVMGFALLIHDYYDSKINFDGTLKRNEVGKGDITEQLELEYLGQSKEMPVEVKERGLSSDELEAVFNQAIDEIDKSYLGKNDSPGNVIYDLDLKDTYCNGLISAYFKFDKYGLISSDGKLNEENIPINGDVVNVTAELSYGEETQIYGFPVVVFRPGLDTEEGQLSAIKQAIKKSDEATKSDETLQLPGQVGNMTLKWHKKMDFRGLEIIILGIAAVAALSIGEKRDAKLKEKQLLDEKERDYPMIVSELSILLGAGMSFRKALERIVSKYAIKKKDGLIRPGYEDMMHTYRKMVDGMGEIAALEDLGQNSSSKEYRKLAMMLVQNLKKGSKDLLQSLEKEEAYAFEMRKQRAIRAGEEASTKLLIPMAGMLFIVIVILVVPALMQFKIS